MTQLDTGNNWQDFGQDACLVLVKVSAMFAS